MYILCTVDDIIIIINLTTGRICSLLDVQRLGTKAVEAFFVNFNS